ncbi:slit -like protein [Brachionus plicatilis]|uniref:Slit-like protein n=1 Tax=Brachionus plicatilis TaxID=10195 RepID=A0A3M7P9W6_BRAPC|nr:slit -like protein [Brachionus plicatilis]
MIKLLALICLLKSAFQLNIQPLFQDCEHTKNSDSNYKNIVVDIDCDGYDSNRTDQFPSRLISIHYQYRIKQLKISGFNLSKIPEKIFDRLLIEKLDLQQNNIQSISANTFQGIIGLEDLNLGENFLAKIPNQAFAPLDTLSTLILSKNRLSLIEPSGFSKLNSLKTLDLSYNQLTELNNAIFKPFEFTLETLFLSGNRLQILPDLNVMQELYYIDVSYNILSDLTDYGVPQKTKALILSNNRLEKIRKETFSMNYNMVFLDLTNNMISDIEQKSFENMINLRILRLGFNNLNFFPDLRHLVNLAELDLSNQNLRYLSEFALDRDDLPISTISRLDLSNNKIDSFDKKAFCSRTGPIQIEYLILDNNPMQKLDPCVFNQLKSSRLTIFFNSNNSSGMNNCDLIVT